MKIKRERFEKVATNRVKNILKYLDLLEIALTHIRMNMMRMMLKRYLKPFLKKSLKQKLNLIQN